jgi:predicted DCC family thiol-disulfide oxidoreductase YuxK
MGDVSQKPIVFFDGVCGLCNRFVDFLFRRDRAGHFRVSPLQGQTAARYLGDREGLPSVVLWEAGRVYEKSAAVLRILWSLGGGWRCTAPLWIVPSPLRDLVYDWVARNRYRWFGKRDGCRVPTAAERERFLA